jgi:hypothetical protein
MYESDTSLANNTGHFNLLTTGRQSGRQSDGLVHFISANLVPLHIFVCSLNCRLTPGVQQQSQNLECSDRELYSGGT